MSSLSDKSIAFHWRHFKPKNWFSFKYYRKEPEQIKVGKERFFRKCYCRVPWQLNIRWYLLLLACTNALLWTELSKKWKNTESVSYLHSQLREMKICHKNYSWRCLPCTFCLLSILFLKVFATPGIRSNCWYKPSSSLDSTMDCAWYCKFYHSV